MPASFLKVGAPAFRKAPNHLIPIHPDNIANNDLVILLEANTIVSSSGGRLRVATTTQERKVVKRLRSFRRQSFLAAVFRITAAASHVEQSTIPHGNQHTARR